MPVDGAISEPMISQVTYSAECSALKFWRSDSVQLLCVKTNMEYRGGGDIANRGRRIEVA